MRYAYAASAQNHHPVLSPKMLVATRFNPWCFALNGITLFGPFHSLSAAIDSEKAVARETNHLTTPFLTQIWRLGFSYVFSESVGRRV
jgi:hypothetical protein